MKRSCWNTLKIWIVNYVVFAIALLLKEFITIQIDNYGDFILYGVFYTILFGVIGLIGNMIVNKKGAQILFQYIRRE